MDNDKRIEPEQSSAVKTVKKSTAPKYIPTEDIVAFQAQHPTLNDTQLALHFNITSSVMSRRLRAADIPAGRLETYTKGNYAVWKYHEREILKAVAPEDIKKASLLQKLTSAGICATKALESIAQQPIKQEALTFTVVFNDNRRVDVHKDKPLGSDSKPIDIPSTT